MKYRRLITKIHLYGGLACFWYLVIFAVSSLHFHHDFGFMRNSSSQKTLEENLAGLENIQNDSLLSTTIQASLDVAGWNVPWKTHRENGLFYTEIQNPKSSYEIQYNTVNGDILIVEQYKGVWSVINSLHGFAGNMPLAPWLVIWKVYTWICFGVVLFSIISGIWLWAGRRGDKIAGWIIVSAIMLVSLLLMVIIYLQG